MVNPLPFPGSSPDCAVIPYHSLDHPLPFPGSSADPAVILPAQSLRPSLAGQLGIVLGFLLSRCRKVPVFSLFSVHSQPLHHALWFCRFKINPGNLSRGLVSCTGAQFCGVAIIETKNRAMAIVEKLEQQLDIPEAVRIHWTGCPNSCGQVCIQTFRKSFVFSPKKGTN